MTKLRFYQRSSYGGAAALYTVGLSLLVLWPFDFSVPFSFEDNTVSWTHRTNGVEFPGRGIIRLSSSVSRLHDALVSGSGITVEVWAATTNDQQDGPARIVSYSKNPSSRNFTLAQDGRDLVMRLRTTETDLNGRPVLNVRDVFQAKDPQHLVVTYNYFEQHVYVNGRLRMHAFIPGGKFLNWDPSCSLVLGNEATGNRSWIGKLFLVGLYNRALSEQEIWKNYTAEPLFDGAIGASDQRVREGLITLYHFSEGMGNRVLDRSGSVSPIDLEIPSQLRVITADREFLATAYSEVFSRSIKFSRVIEILANIVIFIPFGLLLHAALRKRYQSSVKIAALVMILGSLFTISIESLQYFSETRHSSMIDVVGNVIGTGLGIVSNLARPVAMKWSHA